MYGKYGKTLSKETIAKLKNLPEHKLEMIEIRNYERGLEVDIFNTFTQKALTFGITKKNPFESLINQMSLDSSKDFFTEDALNIMNYMSITMPTLYKKNTKL